MESLDAQSWFELYTLETLSDECFPKLRALLSSPSKITAARSFQGSEANTLIDFLDRVSALCASCLSNLKHHPQVLAQLHLDDKHRQLCLRLLSKICKAQEIIPSSYILQEEFLHVRDVQDRGGFSEVRNGEYLGRAVAIKELKPNRAGFNKNFKVYLIHLAHYHTQLLTSGFVEKLLVGNIYPTPTSCPFWEFVCQEESIDSASSLSGCPTIL